MVDMRFFEYEHLPTGMMRDTSTAFYELAHKLNEHIPNSAEKTAGMRKLLEAKDCMVRAVIPAKSHDGPFEGENSGQHPRPE